LFRTTDKQTKDKQKMESITITYPLLYRFKTHSNICKSVCKRYFNIRNSKEIMIKKNGGSKGIWLDRRTFIIESRIDDNLELIPKHEYIKDDFLTNL